MVKCELKDTVFVQLDEQFHSKEVHKWLLGLEGSIDRCYQGSLFVPVLLNIFIDDLDNRRERMFISSAEDTKLGKLLNILEDKTMKLDFF